MEEASLYSRSEKELKQLISRSEIDLVWLDKMQEQTKGAALNHYKNQYFKELSYYEMLKKCLEKFD